MELYEAKNYRDYLGFQLEAHAQIRGYRRQLVEAAGCQLSYLSQVMHSHVELTPDHAAGLCVFWQLDEEESSFFLTLVHYSRSGSPKLKRFLERQIESFREKRTKLSRRIGPVDILGEGHRDRYYGAWYYSAIHVALLVPALRTVEAIAARLRLDRELVARTLGALETMGLARRNQAQWLPTKKDLHLPVQSALAPVQHANWRHKAALQAQEHPEEGFFYTGVHALKRSDVERVKMLLLDCVEKARAVIGPSREEEVVCLALDLFRV